ncbi:MAG: metallophosphoesterase family protein, partial [Candidatus Fimadaptatus sp.]
IMGNSEYMFFNEEVRSRYASEAGHQAWVAAQLGEERMERLKAVPLSRTVSAGGKSLLMLHSRPDSVVDAPLLYQGGTLEAFLADYGANADCVLIGHTHLPLYAVHWSGRPVVNPGSVGCGKDGVVRFALLEIEDGLVSVALRQLRYDKESVLRDYGKHAVPCREKFISMFY